MKHESVLKRGFVAASLAACFALPAGPAMAAERLNPDADEILRSMSRHPAGLKAFSVSADIGNEVITLDGQKLQLNSHADLLIKQGAAGGRRGGFFRSAGQTYPVTLSQPVTA